MFQRISREEIFTPVFHENKFPQKFVLRKFVPTKICAFKVPFKLQSVHFAKIYWQSVKSLKNRLIEVWKEIEEWCEEQQTIEHRQILGKRDVTYH